nr:immunoglobulin heavy chain junction region [Macaca mulatta]
CARRRWTHSYYFDYW